MLAIVRLTMLGLLAVVFPSNTRLPGCIVVSANPALGASFIIVIIVEISMYYVASPVVCTDFICQFQYW